MVRLPGSPPRLPAPVEAGDTDLMAKCSIPTPDLADEQKRVVVAQLTSSTAFGGPEAQMLGLALSFPGSFQPVFNLFYDNGKSQEFGARLNANRIETHILNHDTPRAMAMISEVSNSLRASGARLLLAHGYKGIVVGLFAARRIAIPVIAVSHGWTAETHKVRAYEAIERACLRADGPGGLRLGRASHEGPARGVAADRVVVIRNAVQADRYYRTDLSGGAEQAAMFSDPPLQIVGSAGRLSPEKGFGVLIEAAAIVCQSIPGVGFIHFGDGRLRESLRSKINDLGLERRFILAGFRNDLHRLMAHWDLSVLPSFTEGLPTVVLESYAAGVPVVATAVGGTPEAVADGVDGYLVLPGDPAAPARRIIDVLQMGAARHEMGRRGQERIRAAFTFEVQAQRVPAAFSRGTEVRIADGNWPGPRGRRI